ncbi:PREDICTED: serine protease SP24D-like [Rhagoletis zephyria]|uniref:serine protease SP24D-like n=1 Tax=Rhagoletis zephyria TaxID=28612 RepID=UPI00081145A6|nr:PREDICTED: serine protease SP24D-like [Rhagoletis zephyria]
MKRRNELEYTLRILQLSLGYMDMSKVAILPVLFILSVGVPTNAAPGNSSFAGSLLEVPQSRIYGGQNAAEGQFPYHVLVLRHADGYIAICGGAIISRNYVASTASCIQVDSNTSYSIRAGTVKFNSGGVEVQVAEVKIHPEYSSFNNDIALLRLSSPLDFNDNIKPILLGSTEVPEGSSVTITGWGVVSSGGLADVLQYNTEQALSHDNCVKRIGKLADSMRCFAKSTGNGICDGDFGSPAAYNGVLVGLATFTINDCGNDIPNGFANVVFARDWIRANSDVDCTCFA